MQIRRPPPDHPLLPLGVHELHLTALVPVQPRLVTSENILASTIMTYILYQMYLCGFEEKAAYSSHLFSKFCRQLI